MEIELLERGKYLSELNALMNSVNEGEGKIAVICGEAGIGKTSLVEAFINQNEDKAKIFWGACDDLFTPRPLAPLYDMANKMHSSIIEKLDSAAPRPSIFTLFLNEIHQKNPNIVVIEDAHWADESTLDFIKFLAKRINQYGTLLLITYRNDEIGFKHPLRLTLSGIPTKYYRRFELPPLSKEAVKKFANSFGRDDETLYLKTGGNPFFVTEILMSNQQEIPATVKDLVISRLNRLSPDSRFAVETISVIPGSAEKWLINILIKNYNSIDEAVNSGILKIDDETISFRHELLKIAVEESISELKRVERNSAVLNVLLKQKNSNSFLERIIHHAVKISDKKVIIKYAPLAAKQVSKAGAHELAAKYYKIAIQFSDQLSTEEKLNLLEGRAHECYLIAQIEEGIKVCESVKEILKYHYDPIREGENHRRLSRLWWYAGKDKIGEEYILKAIDILEKFNAGNQLAMSYSNLSQIYMLREKTDPALVWGKKASVLASKLNDIEIEAHALNNIGTAKMFALDNTGEKNLQTSLALSLKNDFHEHACRAYVNLGTANLYRRNLTKADEFFSVGVDYANEKDINLASLCIAGEIAQTKLHMGKWDEAFDICYNVYIRNNVPVMDKLLPMTLIGLIRARRNDPGAFQMLNEANNMVYDTGELLKLVKVKAARAEAFWLKNELPENINELVECYDLVKASDNPWAIGEVAFWLWKGGGLSEIPNLVAEPFHLQIKGSWQAAGELWGKLNCTYEQALALSDGNEKAMKKAIKIFDSLGATAASSLIKQKMRKLGIKNIPKGPRKSTKKNPGGLTSRELEILKLLADGLSNSEIGDKLYISSRTVGNHISNIFSKLNIHSRLEAAAFVHSNQITKK